MLKYIIFDQGIEQDENIIKCPNCQADLKNLKGNAMDRVYICKKCSCRFAVLSSYEKIYDTPIKTYTLNQ